MPTTTEVTCPECGGAVWDNRDTKKNPKAPDFKCRDKSCPGVIWPPKNGARPAPAAAPQKQAYSAGPALPYETETGAAPQTPAPSTFGLADSICAMSKVFLNHVLAVEVPALAKAEIGASDEFVHARVANLLITAEKAGAFR